MCKKCSIFYESKRLNKTFANFMNLYQIIAILSDFRELQNFSKKQFLNCAVCMFVKTAIERENAERTHQTQCLMVENHFEK